MTSLASVLFFGLSADHNCSLTKVFFLWTEGEGGAVRSSESVHFAGHGGTEWRQGCDRAERGGAGRVGQSESPKQQKVGRGPSWVLGEVPP